MEVTNEMLKVARSMQSFELMIKRIIELHEQSKPKPEPVGYIYPSSYAKALRNESSCKMFVVPVTNLDTGEESSLPLYTTPLEPLSEEKINALRVELSKEHAVSRWLLHLIIRLTEQAHGIGVTND